MRELNRECFRMEQVYKFKLSPYIDYYYQYDFTDENDEEYSHDGDGDEEEKSTAEFSEPLPGNDSESHVSGKRHDPSSTTP